MSPRRPEGFEKWLARKLEGGDRRLAGKIEAPPIVHVDVELLLKELGDIAEAVEEAQRILIEHAEREPKIREVLNTPQSPDKHAEGPSVSDHYREILTSLVLVREGSLNFDKANEILGIADFEKEWSELVEVISQHPHLMTAFALLHDVAKPDNLGFTAEDGSRGSIEGFPNRNEDKEMERRKGQVKKKPVELAVFRAEQAERRHELLAKYHELMQTFSAQRPDLKGEALQRAFFDEYRISIHYRGHAEKAYSEKNLPVVERISDQLGLDEEEKKLLRFAIEMHISPFSKFDAAAKPEDVDTIVKKARELGVESHKAIRVLQAGLLADGVLGTKRILAGQSGIRIFDVTPLRNFWIAEQAYPAYKEIEAQKSAEAVRFKTILTEAGLDAVALTALGMKPGPELGAALKAIERSMRFGIEFEGIPEGLRNTIEQRVLKAREKITTRSA